VIHNLLRLESPASSCSSLAESPSSCSLKDESLKELQPAKAHHRACHPTISLGDTTPQDAAPCTGGGAALEDAAQEDAAPCTGGGGGGGGDVGTDGGGGGGALSCTSRRRMVGTPCVRSPAAASVEPIPVGTRVWSAITVPQKIKRCASRGIPHMSWMCTLMLPMVVKGPMGTIMVPPRGVITKTSVGSGDTGEWNRACIAVQESGKQRSPTTEKT
jgi:hypothetical protein